LYLGCSRSARPLPRGFAGHVAHPVRSIAECGFRIAERSKTNQETRKAGKKLKALESAGQRSDDRTSHV